MIGPRRPFVERIRSSLFFVPMVAVVAAAVLGVGMLAVDGRVDTDGADLPLGVGSTVESARSVLSTVAGATISFAGIAFSVSLLIIQLASSQYSPRVVQTLFRDPFNKRVMALVVGTFTYCVVVLRSVRSAIEPGGDDVIPNVSVAIAVVLGIATILAVVAFIDHNAHAMDVSDILQRISTTTIEQVRETWDPIRSDGPGARTPHMSASHRPTVVRADRSGWVQHIDVAALLRCLPDGATARAATRSGRFALAGSPLATVWAPGTDDALVRGVRSAFLIGHTRTMYQDPSYGLRQTVDIAVRALSPGVNDPTTAQDAIFHTAAMLAELLRHDPPDDVTTDESGRVVIAGAMSHDELVRLALDETRRAAASDPAVCGYLLEALDALVESLCADGLTSRTDELVRQRRLVVAGCGRTALLAEDLATIRPDPPSGATRSIPEGSPPR